MYIQIQCGTDVRLSEQRTDSLVVALAFNASCRKAVAERVRTKSVSDAEARSVIGNEKYIIFGKMEYIRISNNDASFSVTMVHRFR